MKGKKVLFLFGLPFFGIGVWMLISISSNMLDVRGMQHWESVQAQLTSAGYETISGEDSDSYKAYASYSYSFGDRSYSNNRVAITGGADNIGSYQKDLGDKLSGVLNRGELIEIYVNPDNPQDAIIDRDLRWGLIGFKSIFLFAFGGVGLGLVIVAWRAPEPKDKSNPMFDDQPWQLNDAWQTSTVKSGAKTGMYFTWGFAILWNLISAPLPFVIYGEIVDKNNLLALIGLLFPLIGIALFIWAVRRTLEWKRFGPAPVTLDPFPGVIGGHAGGTIDISLPFDPSSRFHLTLANIYSYETGTGKNRSRSERVEWQDSQELRAQIGGKGTRLTFRFDVPAGLTDSDAQKNDSDYYLWRLSVEAKLDGTDLNRDYEIPVYAGVAETNLLAADN